MLMIFVRPGVRFVDLWGDGGFIDVDEKDFLFYEVNHLFCKLLSFQ